MILNVNIIQNKRVLGLDSWWQESTGETRGDMEKINGAGDENTGMELGPSHEVGSGQKTLAVDRKHWQWTENIGVLWLWPYA